MQGTSYIRSRYAIGLVVVPAAARLPCGQWTELGQ